MPGLGTKVLHASQCCKKEKKKGETHSEHLYIHHLDLVIVYILPYLLCLFSVEVSHGRLHAVHVFASTSFILHS